MYSLGLLFLALLASIASAQDHDEMISETVTASPDLNPNGSTVSPTSRSFNEFCKLEFDTGDSSDAVERFYYDFNKKACFNFTYTGGSSNQNNFATENECLEQCYMDIGEAVPLNETDVIIIEPRSLNNFEAEHPQKQCLRAPERAQDCPGNETQRFYYSQKWNACFAFNSCSKDKHFDSRHTCESACKPADGTSCGYQGESADPLTDELECSPKTCPKGFVCLHGMRPECCKEESRKEVDRLYSSNCENGQEAIQEFDQYFLPIVATSCDDLICGVGNECQTVGKYFAKCCSTKQKASSSEVSRDIPLAGFFGRGLLRTT